jgi:tetratricopeptide (TPR) repeat protein
LNPQIPVLDASLGRALLHVKNNPEQALTVFQEGLRTDNHNVALYTGTDQALSILRHPAQERVAMLEQYPDLANMPTSLVYELILNLTESGEFEKATALFHNRFFQREEGGTNVRQVWLELQIQYALSQAHYGRCSEALNLVDHLADPVPDLPFSHDGLEPFLRGARFNYFLGNVYKTCNLPERARDHFKKAADQSNIEDAIWGWRASQQLPASDPRSTKHDLQSMRERMKNTGEDNSPSGNWLYNAAMLDDALGNTQQAEKEFRDALLSPDQHMIYHLTRLAISHSNP